MKTPIIKKEIENRPLLWSEVEGYEDIKKEAELYNECAKLILERENKLLKFEIDDWYAFGFVEDFVRNNFNKPHILTYEKVPDQLRNWFEKISKDIENLIDRGLLKVSKNGGLIPKYNRDKSIEKNNTDLEVLNYASYNNATKEKIKMFDSKLKEFTTFTIMYGDIKEKQLPYFSTTYDGKDWGGQAQYMLPKDTIIRAFWEKWDIFHLSIMTMSEYNQMIQDLELVKKYGPTHPNYIEKEGE